MNSFTASHTRPPLRRRISIDGRGVGLPDASGSSHRHPENKQLVLALHRSTLTDLLTLHHVAAPCQVADNLLMEFGTLRRVINAKDIRLRRIVDSATVASIAFYRNAMLQALRPEAGRPAITRARDLTPYLMFDLADRGLEEFRVFYLDFAWALLKEETAAFGSVSECTPYIRTIMVRALELGAAGLIVAHNHPAGDPNPSEADYRMTRRLEGAAKELDIRLLDHLIVTSRGTYSWRGHGLL